MQQSTFPAEPNRQRVTNPRHGKLLLFVAVLAILTVLHINNGDLTWGTENVLFIALATVIAAWSCHSLPVFVLTLISSLAWFVTDAQRESELWNCVFNHISRMLVTLVLIALTSKVRLQLDQAQHLARIDSLTGLPNRQAIIDALNAEIGRIRRFGRSFSIAMLDCDEFKPINDLQGHLAGDRVLQKIATALRKQIRPYDSIGRLGGDEFVLIFSEANIDQITMIVDRLRNAIKLELKSEHPSLTFSIGVVTVQTSKQPDASPLDCTYCLQKADEAMYAAKRSGNDQTRFETLFGRV